MFFLWRKAVQEDADATDVDALFCEFLLLVCSNATVHRFQTHQQTHKSSNFLSSSNFPSSMIHDPNMCAQEYRRADANNKTDGLLGTTVTRVWRFVYEQFTNQRDQVYPGVQGAYYWTEVYLSCFVSAECVHLCFVLSSVGSTLQLGTAPCDVQ